MGFSSFLISFRWRKEVVGPGVHPRLLGLCARYRVARPVGRQGPFGARPQPQVKDDQKPRFALPPGPPCRKLRSACSVGVKQLPLGKGEGWGCPPGLGMVAASLWGYTGLAPGSVLACREFL